MLSERLCHIEVSSILKMSNRVSKMRRAGIEVISFCVGEPDFKTPEHIIVAAKDALDRGETHYTPSHGIMELREAIAEKSMNENNIRCSPENVLVCPAKFGIFAGAYATVDKGDEVIIPDPGWVSYPPIVGFVEAVAKFVNFDSEDAIENLKEAITQKTKAIVINSPSNPTGTVLTRQKIKGIADLAVDHDLYVVSDEIYEKIIYEGEHISIASMPGMFERTITVNGFSKTYAMTGWRLGWAVAPEEIIKGMNKLQSHSITCCTSFAQRAGVVALKGDQKPLEEMLTAFKKRRKVVMQELDKIPLFSYKAPQGAFYIFPRFGSKMSHENLAELLLEKARVAVIPGNAFGANGEGHLRFSYATSEQLIREGMKRIRDTLE